MSCPKTSALLSQKLRMFNQGWAGAAPRALCLLGKELDKSSGNGGKNKNPGCVAELKGNVSLAQELIRLGMPEPLLILATLQLCPCLSLLGSPEKSVSVFLPSELRQEKPFGAELLLVWVPMQGQRGEQKGHSRLAGSL